jgi:hypothetical protein
MSDQIRCQIRCEACDQWADSRTQFPTAEAFFTSNLIGNTIKCSWCGETTRCSIERMRFDEQRDGRKGTFVDGKDAVKAPAKKK